MRLINRKTTPSQQSPICNGGRRLRPASILAGAVGIILITAALIKTMDMRLFVEQMKAYHIISKPILLILGAWILIFTEFILGTALLVSYRPKITITIVASLFLIFIGVNVWAWITQVTEDCGCFGTWLVRTPAEAFIEDLVLLAALVPAWFSCNPLQTKKIGIKKAFVAVAMMVGLILPVVVSGLPDTWIDKPRLNVIETEIEHLQISGINDLTLAHGDYLIVLMLTDCVHCRDAVPFLCDLADQPGFPRLFALSPNDEIERKSFIETYQPSYPIGQIELHAFLRLLGDGDVPRVLFLRDGRLMHIWDEEIPDANDIVQVL